MNLEPNKRYRIEAKHLAGFSTVPLDASYTGRAIPEKLLDIRSWGSECYWGKGISQEGHATLSFEGTMNLREVTLVSQYSLTGKVKPYLRYLKHLDGMFKNSGVSEIRGIEKWDVSNITSMRNTFSGAKNFNGDLSHWDTRNVTDMTMMFYGATQFNNDISNWDVSKVKYDQGMFFRASNFRQNLGKWRLAELRRSGQDALPIFYQVAMTDADLEATFAGWKAFAEANPDALRDMLWFVGSNSNIKFANPNLPSLTWFRDSRGWTELQRP